MIRFIENNDQLKELENKKIIIVPVVDSAVHFMYESVLLFYILDIESKDEWVLNVKHPDVLKYAGTIIEFNSDFIFAVNKKTLIYNKHIPFNAIDVNFLIYPDTHKQFNFYDYIPTHFYLYKNRFTEWTVYPLSILIKMCQDAAFDVLQYINAHVSYISDIKKFDSLYYMSLFNTESNAFEFKGDIVYSNYNPYTLTNRPTNSSFGINFSALSKKDNTRVKLKPLDENKKLVQFDYSSFHVYLLTKMLNFVLPTNVDIYLFLNEQYKFSEKSDRSDIKLDFFKYIYGTTKYDTDLSNLIYEFKQDLYNFFKDNGFVYSFFTNRKIFFNVSPDIEPNKLFNYFLQNAETEYNLLKILKLNNICSSDASVNLILYTYDSFLFEIPSNDTEVIDTIKSILEEDGIPTTVQIGDTYAF